VAYYNRGWAYGEMGDYDKAIADWAHHALCDFY
jgi:hypothetical protein